MGGLGRLAGMLVCERCRSRAGPGGWEGACGRLWGVRAEGRNQSRDTGHKAWGVLWRVLEVKGSSRTCFSCGRLSAKWEPVALPTSHEEFRKHLCAGGPPSSAWGLSTGHSGRAWVGAPWPVLEVLRPRHDSEDGTQAGGEMIRERIDGGSHGGGFPVPIPVVPTPRGPSSQLPWARQ